MKAIPSACRTQAPSKCPRGCARDFKHWAFSLGLSAASFERLAAEWQNDVYAPGDSLFRQGDRPSCIYFVHTGRVKLVRSESTDRRRIVRLISGPSILGELALIAGQPYASTGKVLEEASICRIEAARFQELWGSDPELPRFFARLLAKRLGESDEAGSDLALRSIRERVAKLILCCEEASGAPGAPVSLGLSRQDLAQVLGTGPEVVSRTIASLAANRLISVDGRMVLVLERVRLRQAAGITSIIPNNNFRHCQFGMP